LCYTDLGLQEHRLEGEEYVEIIDEFMEAVFSRWPNVIVQVLCRCSELAQVFSCMRF
jgi:hypothetical protein